ncbi:MAG: UDP-N-acetylmuramate--L-alanine ligase [Myxococcota bacterium]
MARRCRRIHLVGIGGIGMSGIAEVLNNLGYDVQGSDLRDSDVTRRLVSLGVTVHKGHDEAQVSAADVVVISSAVSDQNPEVQAARQRKIPVIRRAEMLAELMRLKYGIAVGGTHGKTTTTSMVAVILTHAGLDPTVVVGGKVNKLGSTAKLGQGPYLVAEADESDGSFLHLSPTVAVVTNIDPEHLDHYQGGLAEIRDVFVTFVNRIPFYGLAVLCIDHPEVQAILPKVEKRFVTYGLSAQADLMARHLRFGPSTHFEVVRRGDSLGDFQLNMLGEHNVSNALAAIAVADELGVSPDVAREALADFDGVDRRFSVRGEVGGIMVVDDYGHHPAEIRTTLSGVRKAYPDRRVLAVFQPHRYSRTKHLATEFASAFNDADLVVLTPLYAAGEAPIEGVSSATLADTIRRHGHRDVRLAEDFEDAVSKVRTLSREGDVVLAFGAGDIGRFGQRLVDDLADG